MAVKNDQETTKYPQQKYFNKRLCSARVVTENCLGMLKRTFGVLYKKTEMRLPNLKYVIMACIMLHNLCLEINDSCLPRWRLRVDQMDLVDKRVARTDTAIQESCLNRMKISN